jgi:hypothetical protein
LDFITVLTISQYGSVVKLLNFEFIILNTAGGMEEYPRFSVVLCSEVSDFMMGLPLFQGKGKATPTEAWTGP